MKMITDFPIFRQTYNYDCGAKAMHSVIAFYGIDTREDLLMQLGKTNKRDGTPISGMIRIANHFRLHHHSGRMNIDIIKRYINRNIPVVLVLQAWKNDNDKHKDWCSDWDDGHYVVAVGYDPEKIYFEDPSAITKTYLTYAELEERWHDVDVKHKKYYHWGMAVYGRRRIDYIKKIIHMD